MIKYGEIVLQLSFAVNDFAKLFKSNNILIIAANVVVLVDPILRFHFCCIAETKWIWLDMCRYF